MLLAGFVYEVRIDGYEYSQKDSSIKSFSLKIKDNSKTTAIIKLIQFKILSPIKRKLLGKNWHPKIDNKKKIRN